MYEVLDGFAANVVAVRSSGRITGEDDRDVLVPAVDRAAAGDAAADWIREDAA